MKHILIIEDEAGIRDFVSQGLGDCGYRVSQAASGAEGWQQLESNRFDCLLLDLRLGDINGIDLCRRLRQEQGYSIPVIMLTALSDTDDVVMGLHAGADDYVVKPFKFVELLARIEAQLRHAAETPLPRIADLTLDPASHQAIRGGKVIDLSIKEYRLLAYLVEHQGHVLSREQLLRDVWDKPFDVGTNVVDVYITYLRAKVDRPFGKNLIHTAHGRGYIMEDAQ